MTHSYSASPDTPIFRGTMSLQPETPSDSTASKIDQPLTELHLFPKFPLEIRRKTFCHALPTVGGGTLRVNSLLEQADAEIGLNCSFSLASSDSNDELPHPYTVACPGHLAMLSACLEFREIYLESHKDTLPAGSKGVMHFNAEHTIVYIENFDTIMDSDEFKRGLQAGWRKQKWLEEVKMLRIPEFCLSVANKSTLADALKLFGSLRTWIYVQFRPRMCPEQPSFRALSRLLLNQDRDILLGVQELLETGRENETSESKLPVLLHRIMGKDMKLMSYEESLCHCGFSETDGAYFLDTGAAIM